MKRHLIAEDGTYLGTLEDEPTDAAFIVEGVRYGHPYSDEAETLEDALGMALQAISDDIFKPLRIKDSKGLVVMDEAAISKAFREQP